MACCSAQRFARNNIVNQSEAQRGTRPDSSTRKNQIERVGKADEARQALCAPTARENSELNLRLSQDSPGTVTGDSIVTGEGRLQATPKAGAMNGGHDWNRQRFQPCKNFLSSSRHGLRVLYTLKGQEIVDIGARDEVGFLGRNQNDSL